jgi:uncharacterized membrane protein
LRRRFRISLPFLLRALLAFVGALPWAFVAFAAFAASGQRAHYLRPLFGTLCHQMPERCMVFFGAPMVVCSRCAGVYAGMALGAVLPPPKFILRHGRAIVWIAASALLLDVIVQNYMAHTVIHALRLATGLAAGWAGCAFALAAVEGRAGDAPPPKATDGAGGGASIHEG